ncbi:MAG: hypothetical protein GY803_27685 [Chloroflexi bacterium]|nr:hypothetical protein [Chloroflexota bacterium]
MNNPSQSRPFDDQYAGRASKGDSSNSEEIKWEIVARTAGLTPATIMAGRLQADNIPARAWQEGAGQAMGLTVGLLGTGFVAVPEKYVEQALEILEEEE